MRPRSLVKRLVLLTLVWLLLALTLQGVVLNRGFQEAVTEVFDRKLSALLQALIASLEVSADGTLTLSRPLGDPRFEQVYSGWYWQVADADGLLLSSRSLWDQALVYHSRYHPVGEFLHDSIPGPRGQWLRTAERDIQLPGLSTRLHVTVAAITEEVDAEVQSFQWLLKVALVLLGLSVLLLVLIQVQVGLRPLRQLRQDLAAIQSGQQPRLAEGYPREIAPLTGALNQVLDHNAEVVRRARTHVGNLAHALKTPLTLLLADAQAANHPQAEPLAEQVRQMRRLIDWHLSRAAVSANRLVGSRTVLLPLVESLVETLSRAFAHCDHDFSVAIPPTLVFQGEEQDLEEMLGNLLENACKWATHRVEVWARWDHGALWVGVDDDGPGLDEAQAAAALQRGKRFDELTPGSGLGLSIVADIAQLYDGELNLERAPLGGLRAVLRLPDASQVLC